MNLRTNQENLLNMNNKKKTGGKKRTCAFLKRSKIHKIKVQKEKRQNVDLKSIQRDND